MINLSKPFYPQPWGINPGRWGSWRVWLGVLAVVATMASMRAELPRPEIVTLRTEGTNLFLTVKVPAGIRRLVLEARNRIDPAGVWQSRDLQWPDGAEGTYDFVVGLDRSFEWFRINGTDTQALPLPAKFYQGRKEFGTIVVPGQSANRNGAPGGAVFDGAGAPATPSNLNNGESTGGGTRAVVESDIWQISGDRVYFFNQNRGLQVVRMTNPDAPVLEGTLHLPAAGEQMYVLPSGSGAEVRHVALLAHDSCNWDSSEVIIVKVDRGIPSETARLRVDGQVRESRLVGDVLYTASYSWRQVTVPDPSGGAAQSVWENVTTVASYDLADPSKPVARDSVTLESNPSAIYATDRVLCVAMEGFQYGTPIKPVAPWSVYGVSSVHLFDISNPSGVIRQAGYLLTAGHVKDKFKLNLRGDVLTVASHKEGRWFSRPVYDAAGRWVRDDGFSEGISSWIQTFDVSNLDAPAKLGQLKLIEGEQTYGTRYDGDRAYVVTFRRVDPLWVVDLSNPTALKVIGELEVPGFSTYIEPLGDRLVTMGQEGSGVAISLFDVADPKKPSLLSRVKLGTWSWSEANNDEKAFKVLTGDGLILVPWAGQRSDGSTATGSGYFQGIQLIDLFRDSLKERGVIEHKLQARRATTYGSRIVSVSATELLVANASDRDKPAVTATLELSSSVDRFVIHGDKLITIQNGTSTEIAPAVRILGTANPEVVLGQLTLEQAQVVGHALKGNLFHVLQKYADQYRTEEVVVTNEVVEKTGPDGILSTNVVVSTNMVQVRIQGQGRLTVLDVGNLPAVSIRGTVTFDFGKDYWGNSLTPLWPSAGSLVWTDTGYNYFWGPFVADVAVMARGGSRAAQAVGPIGVTDARFAPWGFWWWGSSSRTLHAFDVTTPEAPRWVSRVVLDGSNEPAPAVPVPQDVSRWLTFSSAYAGEGKIFASHQRTLYYPGKGEWIPAGKTNPYGQWRWLEEPRSEYTTYLDVVDFSALSTPVVRPAITFPGTLQGIALGGALLYSERNSWAPNETPVLSLDVLAYDGSGVSEATKLPLPANYPHPYSIRGDGSVLLGRPGEEGKVPDQVELWKLTPEAKFEKAASSATGIGAVSQFRVYGDVTLAEGSSVSAFVRVEGTTSVQLVSPWKRNCSIWWGENADATWTQGLWIALGYSGLWHVPIQP